MSEFCDYCGGLGNNLGPDDECDGGKGPVVEYSAGDFHADCLSEMEASDADGCGEVVP